MPTETTDHGMPNTHVVLLGISLPLTLVEDNMNDRTRAYLSAHERAPNSPFGTDPAVAANLIITHVRHTIILDMCAQAWAQRAAGVVEMTRQKYGLQQARLQITQLLSDLANKYEETRLPYPRVPWPQEFKEFWKSVRSVAQVAVNLYSHPLPAAPEHAAERLRSRATEQLRRFIGNSPTDPEGDLKEIKTIVRDLRTVANTTPPPPPPPGTHATKIHASRYYP